MYKGYTLKICSDLVSGSNFIVQAKGGGGGGGIEFYVGITS